jgi:hypothetical protein
MTRLALLVIASLLVVFALTACGENDAVLGLAGTQMAIAVEPSEAAAEEPTRLTVSAHNQQSVLKSVSIDFTGDGTWDETQDFNAPSVKAEFSHVYPKAGMVTVRAVVRDVSDESTVRTLALNVGAPRLVPVTYELFGSSPEGGVCSASGAPATCDGCWQPLSGSIEAGVKRSLGSIPHRATARIAQNFDQWPYAGGQDVLYSCRYSLRLMAGTPPDEIPIALGHCTTSSIENPARLGCNIVIEGKVP